MLGSVQDAEDALQEALPGAWRGLGGFEARSSVRTWLYRITTNACIKTGQRRPKRLVSMDYHPAYHDVWQLGEVNPELTWLEPISGTLLTGTDTSHPEARYEARESMELAFVAALQHLPATQRAVLILREVLVFSAAEVAALLDTTVASVNSALQRARAALEQRVHVESQQAILRRIGEDRQRELVSSFIAAWERADVPAILNLLVEDARFTMPPLPAWFQGRADIGRFIGERCFATPWRMLPASANGQLAIACYQEKPDTPVYPLSAINVLTLRGDRIAEITGFIDPARYPHFDVPPHLPPIGFAQLPVT
ncbi:MAG: RNA polymerase subunit sigma-70 [Chloroflexota bacterium]|nr:RNA polymerase subunit sigma-70 [Chloroflexota bacterium]